MSAWCDQICRVCNYGHSSWRNWMVIIRGLRISMGHSMVFPWFSHGFPMVFLVYQWKSPGQAAQPGSGGLPGLPDYSQVFGAPVQNGPQQRPRASQYQAGTQADEGARRHSSCNVLAVSLRGSSGAELSATLVCQVLFFAPSWDDKWIHSISARDALAELLRRQSYVIGICCWLKLINIDYIYNIYIYNI